MYHTPKPALSPLLRALIDAYGANATRCAPATAPGIFVRGFRSESAAVAERINRAADAAPHPES